MVPGFFSIGGVADTLVTALPVKDMATEPIFDWFLKLKA